VVGAPACAGGGGMREEGSSSFLQKRTKKLLSEFAKVFWLFFAKKNCFLSFGAA
jgi:hypothetical protein